VDLCVDLPEDLVPVVYGLVLCAAEIAQEGGNFYFVLGVL